MKKTTMNTRNGIGVFHRIPRILFGLALVLGALFPFSAENAEALTIEPSTWNIVGLDSNAPASGPNRFPVGARICGGVAGNPVTATFVWDTGGTDNGTYIYLRPGSDNPVTVNYVDNGTDICAEALFEVEITKDANAFNQTRRYHIEAAGLSTPTPREVFVERLVSQGRNAVTDIKFGTSPLSLQSVAPGGSMDLVEGSEYYIRMEAYTATQGYEQLESFVNFPNTIFQVLSVEATFSADDSDYVTSPSRKFYADGCYWENDPGSPYYRACLDEGKAGGDIVVTYHVRIKVKGVGGGTETMNTLIHDFSGSSFHYNSDFSTAARVVNIIDPTAITITKTFGPNPTNPSGVSTLTFVLSNPNAGVVSGLTFTDTFPTSPGAMVVASAPNAATAGCGTPTFSPAAGAGSISFSNGTIAGNSSCTAQVMVTTPALGDYVNTTGHLFIGSLDTGKTDSDTLTVDNSPPPPLPPPSSCATRVVLARWDMNSGTAVPPAYSYKASNVATATASYVTSGTATIATAGTNTTPAWGATAPTGGAGWSENPTAPNYTLNNYFQFVLDTSRYGGVQVTFDTGLYGNADWASPNSNVYVTSSTNGLSFSLYSPYPQAGKGGWVTGLSASAAATGTNTTTFRFGTTGSGKAAATMYLDNVVFTGCLTDPPTFSKTFSTDPVASGGTSTLNFVVVNPNIAAGLSGIGFSDTLPAGLTLASAVTSSQCLGTVTGASGGSVISLSGGSLSSGATCTIAASVRANTDGPHNNVSGFVYTAETGTNTGASGMAIDSLTAILPPTIAKRFAPNPILSGGTTTLTFTITNPNQNNALSGIAFTDTLPALLTIASSTSSQCGGVNNLVTNAGARTIALSNGALSAAGSCTMTVLVTAPSVGVYSNTTGTVTHVVNGATANGNAASDTLTVTATHPGLSLLKQLATSATPTTWTSYLALSAGVDVYYRFTIENSGDVDLTSVSVSDPGLSVSLASCDNPTLLKYNAATCVVGPVTASSGSHANTGTAYGIYSGSSYTSNTSTATYATTSLTLATSLTQTYYAAEGNTLNYSYLVTNAGAARLVGPVTISDAKVGAVTCPSVSTVGNNDNSLDPGEALTCTANYSVTAADVTAKVITNTATASTAASGPISGVTSNADGETVRLAAELTVVKTDNVGGSMALGNRFIWTLTVTNAASAGTATFTNGQTLLKDELPVSGATYTFQPQATLASGATGTIGCSIVSSALTCTANGTVVLPPGGVFSDSITTTPTVTGALVNPKSGGVCKANPLSEIIEIDATNNSCSNTVTAISPALSAPTVVKTFGPNEINTNNTSVLTVTLTNANVLAIETVAFTDTYPSGLVNTGSPNPATTCGGTVTASALGTSLTLTGGTVPASGSCTVTVNVTSASPGTYINSTGDVTSSNAATAPPATATLTVGTAATGNKQLYLYRTPSQKLSRTVTPADATPVSVADGGSQTWTLNPVLTSPVTISSSLSSTVPVNVYLDSTKARTVTVELACSSAPTTSISKTLALNSTTPTLYTFNLPLASSMTCTTNAAWTLTIKNQASSPIAAVNVYMTSGGNNSYVSLPSQNVISVDSVAAYDATYSGGTALASFSSGTIYIRAAVSDPFGTYDIVSAPTISIKDPAASWIVSSATMTQVADSGAVKTFEYAYMPAGSVSSGYWTASVKALEGTEGAVSHTRAGTFKISPSLLLVKSRSTIWDPINLGVSPKTIPGAEMVYTLTIQNSGYGAVDSDSLVFTDPIPANTVMCADAACYNTPVQDLCDTSPCGLTFTYPTDVTYTCGVPATPCPNPDASGWSANVTSISINPKGAMNGTTVPASPKQYNLKFKVKIN